MKTIGLIAGMSWESTIPYYRYINQTIREQLGGLHSAKIIMYSVDFHEIERLQHAGEWDKAGEYLANVAKTLANGGADFLVLCTNTMHKVAPAIENAVEIPLLHIAEPTADKIKQAGFSTVGLLGTRFTMEQAFYRDRLSQKHNINVVVPSEADRQIVHQIIYDELCQGIILDHSREQYQQIIARLIEQGAEAIILGCTEISLLVGAEDSAVALFDTTEIHAEQAAILAIS